MGSLLGFFNVKYWRIFSRIEEIYGFYQNVEFNIRYVDKFIVCLNLKERHHSQPHYIIYGTWSQSASNKDMPEIISNLITLCL